MISYNSWSGPVQSICFYPYLLVFNLYNKETLNVKKLKQYHNNDHVTPVTMLPIPNHKPLFLFSMIYILTLYYFQHSHSLN